MKTLLTRYRAPAMFGLMFLMLVAVGVLQSWSVTFTLLNLCLISAIMALGVNIQWGYAGLFNVGVMGFAALGGLAAVLVSMPPVPAAYAAGGWGILGGLAIGVATIVACTLVYRRTKRYSLVALAAAVG
ncbi:MAG: branched-chain amino acid ABC transporter permease, partial [Litorivicinus sp.]